MNTRNSPSSETITEVVFRVTDSTYPFVGVTEAEGCVVSLERMLPRESGEYAEFFSITGADPDRLGEHAEANEHVQGVRVVTREDDRGLFEFTVSTSQGACPARDLAELGAIPREITASDGEGTIVAEVIGRDDVSDVISTFRSDHPNARLVAKREKGHSTPLFGANELERALSESLTERQQEVLQVAFEAGYYEWPRTVSGQTLADELGIAQSTLSKHLRNAEREVLSMIYRQHQTGLGS